MVRSKYGVAKTFMKEFDFRSDEVLKKSEKLTEIFAIFHSSIVIKFGEILILITPKDPILFWSIFILRFLVFETLQEVFEMCKNVLQSSRAKNNKIYFLTEVWSFKVFQWINCVFELLQIGKEQCTSHLLIFFHEFRVLHQIRHFSH